MLEIRLTGESLATASVLPPSDADEPIHVILSKNGTAKIIPSLWASIFTDARLRCLSLIDLQLYQSDARVMADYLREQTYLNQLTFDDVAQSVFSFDHILNEGLRDNKSIQTLTLSHLNCVDAATIASLVQHNDTIKYLSLAHDNISPDGSILIADALRSNSTLVSLDLSHNRIGQRGETEFTKILQSGHPSLVQIHLNDNDHDNAERTQPITGQCSDRTSTSPPETEPMLIELPSSPSPSTKYSVLPMILVAFLFFLWGIPNQLNDVLIRQFSKSFLLSPFEAGLVQSAFYIGYFFWALPAAYVIRRWGYKVGILLGLCLFGLGSCLFWPAAVIGKYTPFLISLFIIATGLAFLETAANPFIAHAAGPAHSSEKRLNIAQAFNPLGAITGALVGTFFIFSGVEYNDQQVKQLQLNNTYNDYLKQETLRVVRPYVVLGGVTFLWAILIAFVPFPANTKSKTDAADGHTSLCRPLFLFSVAAQFAYVGAQVGSWSYIMQYAKDYVSVDEKLAGYLLTGTLVMFAVGRLTSALLMHFGLSPSILLAVFSLINVLLVVIAILVPNIVGFVALFFTSFFMSLMFPTIFALGIKGMSGHTAKLAGCVLVMAIIGGGVITPLMGLIAVKTKRLSLAYTLPGGAYLLIALYALLAYVLTTERSNSKG